MSIVVRHKTSGRYYLLLGAGMSAYKSSMPGVMLGSMNPIETAGSSSMIAVCDDLGRIGWFDFTELYVDTVDGQRPCDILAEALKANPPKKPTV